MPRRGRPAAQLRYDRPGRAAMVTPTLSLDEFWSWIVLHPNCILRAGTPEATFYDDDDLHWYVAHDEPDYLLVQLLRGKRLIGELAVAREEVAYVQAVAGEREGEHLFELISESETDRVAACYFVLSHGFEPEDTAAHGLLH